jgi:hypothetical protein
MLKYALLRITIKRPDQFPDLRGDKKFFGRKLGDARHAESWHGRPVGSRISLCLDHPVGVDRAANCGRFDVEAAISAATRPSPRQSRPGVAARDFFKKSEISLMALCSSLFAARNSLLASVGKLRIMD